MTFVKENNIVLIGFMASGKSRLGKLLAKRLDYELIDCDERIVSQEGMPIKDIFAHKGEGYFRSLESSVLKSLLGQKNKIIVTGGGAPLFFDNAMLLKNLGHIFFLDANFSLIAQRLLKNSNRPLASISNDHDWERLKSLYHYRKPAYEQLGTTIDVNQEDQTKACEHIIRCFKSLNILESMDKTMVRSAKDYPIYHHNKIMDFLPDIIDSLGLRHHRCVIITNNNLKNILKDTIDSLITALNRPCDVVTFNDGEQYKNINSVEHIHEQMFHLGCNRQTLVLALGGGNVGDVAGFAAGVFMRGIPFIQIPTTLLSMVDASIGGKTGIDNQFGKNLIGLFYNPKAVVIDPQFLTSLPKDDFACGMAEIIKHAIIGDQDLFYDLFNSPPIEHVIKRALKVKADIIFDDPHEKTIRAHLNLGHTFAHAIETVSNYSIKHGTAVAIGLMLATKLSKQLGILERDFEDDLARLLSQYHLPTKLPDPINPSDVVAAMKHDKKRDQGGLNFIVPKRLGEVVIHRVCENEALRSMNGGHN